MTELTRRPDSEPARKPYLALCQPDLKPRVEAAIRRAGQADRYEVMASSFVPDGQVIVVNEEAVRDGAHPSPDARVPEAVADEWETLVGQERLRIQVDERAKLAVRRPQDLITASIS